MTYKVIFKRSVLKDMKKIPKHIRRDVWDLVDELKHGPHPRGSKKIHGYEHSYRVRIGRYRVVYEVKKSVCVITVIKVGHRKDVYKDL